MNIFGNFWRTLGCALFQHLVTLVGFKLLALEKRKYEGDQRIDNQLPKGVVHVLALAFC